MSSNTFTTLGVPTSLAEILGGQGITTPTPIQAATLPDSVITTAVLMGMAAGILITLRPMITVKPARVVSRRRAPRRARSR